MPTINQSVSNTLTLSQGESLHGTPLTVPMISNLQLQQNCNINNSQFLDAYGTIIEANLYFDNRLRSVAWKRANNNDKRSALHEATLMLDRLNYAGSKTDLTQVHEFPRAPDALPILILINAVGIPLEKLIDDTKIPEDIKKACFEIAIKLIQGYDPDRESDLLSSTSQSFSDVRTTYNRDFIPDYMRAGIPSFRAWTYLKPFLRDPMECHLTRE